MPTQPLTMGCEAATKGTADQIRAAPIRVFTVANAHSWMRGRGTELPVQNATAFIPGQHREYAINRNGEIPAPEYRSRETVIHFAPMNRANAMAHINAHPERLCPKAIASPSNPKVGNHFEASRPGLIGAT